MNASLESLLERVADTVEFLDFESVGVNSRGVFNNTPLHVVISWRDDAAIATLINGGADVNAKGESNFTPLHKAIIMKNASAVEILLDHGADPAERNNEGDDAIQLAQNMGDKRMLEALQKSLNKRGGISMPRLE